MRSQTKRRHRAVLRAAQSYVRAAYSDPDLSLAEVAAAAGSSARQLQRIFQEEAGEDFRSYLVQVRMERAVEFLSRTPDPLPVYRVAPQVGYRQASGLRQAFKRVYGYNPSEIQPPPPEYLGTWSATPE